MLLFASGPETGACIVTQNVLGKLSARYFHIYRENDDVLDAGIYWLSVRFLLIQNPRDDRE
jgi:hypothetical protein